MSRPHVLGRAAALLVAVVLCAACSWPPSADETPGAPTTIATTPVANPSAMPTAEAPATGSSATDPAAEGPVESDGRQSSTVVVTSLVWNAGSGAVEASAYVPVVEDGGRCTLTLVAGGSTVTTESIAYPDASSTSCDLLTVPGSQLASGPWEAVVGYLSPATRASSDPLTIEVP